MFDPPVAEEAGLVETAPSIGVREVFRRFWPDARPFRWYMVLSLGLVLVSPLLDAAAIWLFKVLIDDVLTPRDFSLFPLVAVAYAGITIVMGIVGFGESYLTVWIGEHFLNRLRIRVFTHLHTLSVDFFDRRRLGDTLSRLTTDVASIESLVLSGITQTVASLVKIVVFAGVLFYLDWRLTVVALLVVPLFLAVARFFAMRIKSASREVAGRTGSIGTVAEESLGNAPLIQAYGRESAEVRRFTRQSRSSLSAELSAARIGGLFEPLVDLLEVLAIMAIVGVGIWELASGRITLGGLLAFLVYLSQLYSPVSNLGQLSNVIYGAAASAERILELFDQRPHVPAPRNPKRLDRVRGAVRLDRVGFHYPDTADEVLHDVDLTAEPGERVAVVGASGAGKSTLTKLLLRFYDPDRGSISLDGADLRELDPKELRSHIAIVLQETLLLDGTIEDNIRAGKPDADRAELVDAARAADAHDFIAALPDGYETRVGQRGRLLSGGQRQRIAIARAMIRDAPILLLDEPTASLDAEAGQRILGPLNRLMAGRTTIVISHNLLTVTDADKILYLDHGRVTGLGTHSELLAGNNGYAHLYHLHHPSEEVVHGAPAQRNGGTREHT
ncbi:ABC transporter ATP-binding protein [Saccharopolyspora sp. 6M]|uniref:ABC transporter ATP-binding protein n=1 Tax=Saccharopolyspora sp. 6M TaxID=2877237 RepID=UPI001CD59FE9|nr:ABC transporter ATP-binding protein [Saccharopolyspora sp. 6M]MCA1224702.1 ABC transporter ATP-binding protein/permease [Saccharopolyspora sp. 6M]